MICSINFILMGYVGSLGVDQNSLWWGDASSPSVFWRSHCAWKQRDGPVFAAQARRDTQFHYGHLCRNSQWIQLWGVSRSQTSDSAEGVLLSLVNLLSNWPSSEAMATWGQAKPGWCGEQLSPNQSPNRTEDFVKISDGLAPWLKSMWSRPWGNQSVC